MKYIIKKASQGLTASKVPPILGAKKDLYRVEAITCRNYWTIEISDLVGWIRDYLRNEAELNRNRELKFMSCPETSVFGDLPSVIIEIQDEK